MKAKYGLIFGSIVVLFGSVAPSSSAQAATQPPTVTTSLDTYSLDVTITVVEPPRSKRKVRRKPLYLQEIQRSVDGGPWEDAGSDPSGPIAVIIDSPERGFDVAYRGRTSYKHRRRGTISSTPWSSASTETVVPLQGVPIVRADDDVPPLGTFDNDDLEDALAECYALGGCNLVLEEATYEDVEVKIGEHNNFDPVTETVYSELAAGFAMVGQGMGKSILQGKVYPVDDDWRTTILLDTVPFDGWIFQDFTLQGRKKDQPAPDPGVYVFNASGFASAPPPGYNLPGYNSAPFIPNRNLLPAYDKKNLLIHDLEVREYVGNGLSLIYVDDMQIRDNVIFSAGCHHACESHNEPGVGFICDVPFVGLPDQEPETLCGSNDPGNLADWNESFPTSTVPGTKVVGYGINAGDGISGGLIDGNTISFATKHGVALFGRAGTGPCASEGVIVSNNTSFLSTTGFANNGGCNSTFVGNTAHTNGLAGQDYTANLGRGFVCGGRGDNNLWLDNLAYSNGSSGYSLACGGPTDTHIANVMIDGNVSSGNCLGGAQSSDTVLANGYIPSGFTITNHTIQYASECKSGLELRSVDGVSVSLTSIDASRSPSLPPGTEAFDRVFWADRVTSSSVDLDLQIGDFDITSQGYYDSRHAPTLSNVDVTIDETSSAGGSCLQPYTMLGTATGNNVTHNGVLLP